MAASDANAIHCVAPMFLRPDDIWRPARIEKRPKLRHGYRIVQLFRYPGQSGGIVGRLGARTAAERL